MPRFKCWEKTKNLIGFLHRKQQQEEKTVHDPSEGQSGGGQVEPEPTDIPQNVADASEKTQSLSDQADTTSTLLRVSNGAKRVALEAGPTSSDVEPPPQGNDLSASSLTTEDLTAPTLFPRPDGAGNAPLLVQAEGVYPRPSPPHSRIFALVIAIDKYENLDPEQHLKGCVADAEDFVDFLEQTLRVPKERIVKLYNNQATRAQILGSFDEPDSGLFFRPDISRGDPIVIFYAGHGSQGVAPKHWAAERDQSEMILPYDVAIRKINMPEPPPDESDDQLKAVCGIPDITFNSLMRRLAYHKGENLLVVLDSCHSGGMMRNAMTRRERAVPAELFGPIPINLDEKILRWTPKGGARAASMVLPTGFAYEAMESHILLAACQPDESAEEARFAVTANGNHGDAASEGEAPISNIATCQATNTQIRGAFTFNLLNYLRKMCKDGKFSDQLTYARLVNCVVGQPGPVVQFNKQNPLCQGTHRDCLLFTTFELPGEAGAFAVRREESSVFVLAGEIHGVVKNTRFTILDEEGLTKDMTDGLALRAVEVTALECTVRVESEARGPIAWESITPNARAVVVAWNTGLKPMKIHTTLPVPTQLAPVGYTRAKSTEYYDVSIKKTNKHWIISHFDPLTFIYCQRPQVTLDTNEVVLEPARVADVIAQWLFHLYRFHTPGPTNRDLLPRVVLRSLKKALDGRHEIYTPASEEPEADVFHGAEAAQINCHPLSPYKVCGEIKEAQIYEVGPQYGLTLYNNSEDDLFPYVFYFDPTQFEVMVWYHPSNGLKKGPLPRRNTETGKAGELAIGYGVHTKAIQFRIAEGAKKDVGFLKVFVSTSYVNLKGIAQAGLKTRDKRNARMEQSQLKSVDAWASSVYVLTCRESSRSDAHATSLSTVDR